MEPLFMVFDTECTGLDANSGRVLELGAVVVNSNGVEQRSFETLFSFADTDYVGASDIHGIYPWMLEGAPLFENAVGNFIEFAEGAIPVAHNAPFDVKFLRAEFARAGLAWPDCRVLDTLTAARKMVRETPNHKLGTLADYFGVKFEGQAHSALADARVTSKVFVSLLGLTGPFRLPEVPVWPRTSNKGSLKKRP